jgi:hypothetical protein
MHCCWYCGTIEAEAFERDHQLPIVLGGVGDDLVDACRPCNKAKGPRTVEEFRVLLARYAGQPIVFAGEAGESGIHSPIAQLRDEIGSRDPVWLDALTARQARAAVLWQQAHGDHRATLRRLVDDAVALHVRHLKDQLNGGEDFPEPPELFQPQLLGLDA